jgi:hypothetical protein
VEDGPLRFALRETRNIMTRPTVMVSLLAVIVIMAISGPFGTSRSIPPGPRMAYWAVVVVSTFGTGALISAGFNKALRRHRLAPWLLPISVGLVTGVAVTLVVVMINWVSMGVSPNEPNYFWGLAANVMAVAVVIAVVIQMTDPVGVATPPVDPKPIAILDRLELARRGPLISMSMQDHYAEIVTTKGSSLILIRLSDAIREVGDTPGMQVHRSHWVATSHVRAARREGDRAVLTLSDGREIPVSRTYVKAVKAAGLL